MKTKLRYFISIVAVTATAFLLSETALYKILSLSTYSGRDESFSFSDFYARTAYHGVARMSNDIVLVDIGDLNRRGIAEMLDSLSAMKPKTIALDVFFRFPGQEGDGNLIEAVCSNDCMVLPRDANRPELVSFFYEEAEEAVFGAVNLSAGSARDVIRSYCPVFETEDGPLKAFGFVVAEQLHPDLAALVLQRGAPSEFIRFDGVEFPIIEAEGILSGDASIAEIIRDKAVFVGDLNDPQDKHVTSVDNEMSGLLIHAKIAQTVLFGQQMHEISQKWVVLIAILVCALFVWLYLLIRDHCRKASSLLVRATQFILMVIFFYIGFRLYKNRGILLDFALPMLMLGLATLAFDLVFGIYHLAALILTKIKKK
ncbi:MAG: CHASE2 domain-containing protein [Bacteroidales bacterium]|nr:CHASE2 domain-containing protein [Bacteroidales bacterium]